MRPAQGDSKMSTLSFEEQQRRRHGMDQALASSRIEGHVPSPEFLADVDAFVAGTMTGEQVRAASLARALAADRAAQTRAAAAVDHAA